MIRDCRYAIRVLFSSPASTLVAILALAIGIGANTAIFSILNSVVLKPLRYREPQNLLFVHHSNENKKMPFMHLTPHALSNATDRSQLVEMGGFRFDSAVITGQASPERVEAGKITPALFPLLGVQPERGRNFSDAEGKPGSNPAVILSHGLWQRRFGGDPGVLGRAVVLDGVGHEVIGVMPASFSLLDSPIELFTPIVMSPQVRQDAVRHDVRVVARLKAGASAEQARAELESIGRRIAEENPQSSVGWNIRVKPLTEHVVGDVRSSLVTLMGAVLCVLLIACANVASMLLARSNSRQKEMAVRSALGASPWALAKQLLVESVILSLCGGLLGIGVAWLVLRWLAAAGPSTLPRIREVSIDGPVLLFTFAVSLVTGVVFGLAPALSSLRSDVNSVLKSAGRTGMGSTSRTFARKALVVLEVALSLVLLTGAGLLIRSFWSLSQVNPGFQPDNVQTFRLSLPAKSYDGAKAPGFFKRAIEAIEKLPGVQAVGVTRDIPLSAVHPTLNFVIDGRAIPTQAEEPQARFRFASHGYFRAMGLKLVKGRFFEAADSPPGRPVAIINEALAEQYWPGEDPIGKRVKSGFDNSPLCTIVGVVGNTQSLGLDAKPGPELFYHYEHLPAEMVYFLMSTSTIAVRTASEPGGLAGPIRDLVARLDPELAVYDLRTMSDMMDRSVAQPKFRLTLMTGFGIAALALAALGLYGLLAYSVGQRTNEIGVRLALGAQRSDVLKMIVREGLSLAGLGAAVGLVLSFFLVKSLEKLLFGIEARDPVTFLIAPVVLLVVALAASYWPARAATAVDPMNALRG